MCISMVSLCVYMYLYGLGQQLRKQVVMRNYNRTVPVWIMTLIWKMIMMIVIMIMMRQLALNVNAAESPPTREK